MFKKRLKINAQHTISTKDRKKLKQELHQQFDRDTVDKFFEYSEKLDQQKVEKSKIVIYSDESDPLLVDSTSNRDYFPTVYCMNLFPTFVKIVLELNSGVEKFLQKGAQLMWPGVVNFADLPDFKIDEVVGIKTGDGRFVAIGALACSKKELEVAEKREGIAAYILHVEGDTLFDFGSKTVKQPVFQKAAVAAPAEAQEKAEGEDDSAPAKEKEKVDKDKDDDENDDTLAFYKQLNKNKGGAQIKTQNLKKGVQTFSTKTKQAKNNASEFDDDNPKQKGKKGAKGKNKETTIAKEDNNENEDEDKKDDQNTTKESNAVSTKDMDAYILEAFLNAIVLSLDDSDLPIENANLWNNHILPCRPTGVELDLKYSSHKKLGKFFNAMDKLGLITYKEASKKSAVPQITVIHKENKKISDWEATISAPLSKESEEKEKAPMKHEITHSIENLCKPDSLLKKYLGLAPSVEFIPYEEMDKRIREFLKKANLIQKDNVVVNEQLKDDFHINLQDDDDEDEEKSEESEDEDKVKEDKNHDKEAAKKKKVQKAPATTIKLSRFMQIIEKHLTYVYKITDLKTKKEVTKQGKFEGITIYAEKAHNKFITRVSSLGSYGINLDALLSEWQIKFATSGSIHEAANKSHTKEITLQGTFLDEVKDYLMSTYKLQESMINLVNKVDKKKKKQLY